jgi:formate-dependent nitrite reductase membrane component NrfD
MSDRIAADGGPQDRAGVPASASQCDLPRRGGWAGPTYYGRPQLKAAPFNKLAVGGYIFLAGLSGAAALLAAIADAARSTSAAGVVRRGRYLSLLTMTIGPLLLIFDLHTPQRFYNMLRIAKRTSPMSIGTWILMTFSGFAGLSAVAQFISDHVPLMGWLRPLARASQVPAAAAGAGLSTYTASLLSATSTPEWAAAPQPLAVRFGASSVASAAAALALGERSGQMRRTLETVACMALAVEGVATMAQLREERDRNVAPARQGTWGEAEHAGAVGIGLMLPLGLYAASRLLRGNRRPGALSDAASWAVLAGSLILRITTLGVGNASANRPEVSFAFAQPRNLPPPRRRKVRWLPR